MKKTVLFLTLVSYSTIASAAVNSTKPITLIALSKDSGQYINICKAVESDCKTGTAIWKEKDSNVNFYLTSSDLQLVKVRKNDNKYTKVNIWNFSKENKTDDTPDDALTKDYIYIYPALYPLNKTKMAVALVSKWSTAYSGGGRVEEYANFMMINDDSSYQVAFNNVPFSSKEMIRACFTEEDYAKKLHCHDENWSILNLKITDDSKEFYSWTFITKSYNWPAFTDKTSTQVKNSEYVAYPFQLRTQSKG